MTYKYLCNKYKTMPIITSPVIIAAIAPAVYSGPLKKENIFILTLSVLYLKYYDKYYHNYHNLRL